MDPWERQKGETERQWAAFVVYRDMEAPRSIRKVQKALGLKGDAHLEKWSSLRHWPERARAFDAHMDALAVDKLRKDRAEFKRRAVAQARAKAQTLMLPDVAINRLLASKNVDQFLDGLSARELLALSLKAARALPALLKAEALALGEATEIVEERREEDSPIAKAVAHDPAARRAANELLERAAFGGPPGDD